MNTPIDDNLKLEYTLSSLTDDELDEELPQTPLPSPSHTPNGSIARTTGFNPLAQVVNQITALWSSARERVFGEDYWIPTDQYEVVFFPPEILTAHRTVYPPTTKEDGKFMLRVVQGSIKNEPSEALYHVVYSYKHHGHLESLSIFRSRDVGVAMDFCRRCQECRVLLKLIDKNKDPRRKIRDMTLQFELHPLWRMIHIAIAANRKDVFSDEGYEYLKKNGYNFEEIVKTVCSPEGKYPLMLAIEKDDPDVVRFLLQHEADPADRDMRGNNAMHLSSLISVQMLEVVWECEKAKPLLNSLNNDFCTPVLVAIRNTNPRCLKTLLNFGAALNLRAIGKNPLFEALTSKGKSIEVIKEILEACPTLLNEKDEQTGNTGLHVALYKTPLMAILFLKHKELDLNARNFAGQTPLHIYASRNDISCILTLASYDCDLNAKNSNGDTALHIAVSHKFLESTRLLLSLGANPNVANFQGDSPRHMAAKLNETNLLKSLIICGAVRCAPTKTGCVSGCVNERSMRLLSKSASASNADSLASPRSLAVIEEIETRTAEVSPIGNKIYQYQQKLIYEEMLEKLSKMAEENNDNSNYINVLSLDGGGIRGLVIIQILIEIERVMGEPIFKYFDWCAGTSTGALIAAGLTQGKTLRECQKIYLRLKDLVFDGWVRPYNSKTLEDFMQLELGNTTLMSDLRWPRLLFTTVRADCFPVKLDFMRNYRLALSDTENDELGFFNPSETLLWKAIRRTSAAPTYFSCVDNKYVDGGLVSNNPCLDLLAEIDLWNTTNRYTKAPHEVKLGSVISIGTGVIPTVPMDPNSLELSTNPYSAAMAIKNLGIILVEQVTQTDGPPVNRALSWCSTLRAPYFRLSAPLFKDIAMDTKDDDTLARMMWECLEYTYQQRPYIEAMCTLIKKVGESWKRRHLFKPKNPIMCDSETQTSDIFESEHMDLEKNT